MAAKFTGSASFIDINPSDNDDSSNDSGGGGDWVVKMMASKQELAAAMENDDLTELPPAHSREMEFYDEDDYDEADTRRLAPPGRHEGGSSPVRPRNPLDGAVLDHGSGLWKDRRSLELEDIIDIGTGGAWSVRTLLQAGDLVVNSAGILQLHGEKLDGRLADDTKAQQEQQQSKPQAREQQAGAPLDEVTESTIAELEPKLGEATVNSLQALFANREQVPDDIILSAAQEAGMSQREMKATLESIQTSFLTRAAEAISDMGLDGQAVLAHAYHRDPDGWSNAVYQLTEGNRSVKGFRQLGKRYWQNMDTLAPQALLDAEVNGARIVWKDGEIRVLLDEGGETNWRGFLNMGASFHHRRYGPKRSAK